MKKPVYLLNEISNEKSSRLRRPHDAVMVTTANNTQNITRYDVVLVKN